MAIVAKSYTGAITAATAMVTTGAQLKALTVNPTATAVVTLYDNASAASGTILFQKNFAAAGMYSINFGDGLRFTNGVTVAVATAAAQVTLYVE